MIVMRLLFYLYFCQTLCVSTVFAEGCCTSVLSSFRDVSALDVDESSCRQTSFSPR